VHQFGRANNGIHRAGLNALGATDAVLFDNHHHLIRGMRTPAAVVGQGRDAEQVRQGARADIAAGRAVVDTRFAARQGFGIRAATIKAALTALGLREQAVDAFDKSRENWKKGRHSVVELMIDGFGIRERD